MKILKHKGICYLLLFCFHAIWAQSNTTHILFVGNSLTYTNDLPHLVKEEAKRKNKIISTKMIAYPNYGLEDHWNDGKVQRLIASKEYDFVIIQQGPSSQSYGRTSLITFGEKLAKLCEDNQSQLVYFMVWPSKLYYYTFDGVIKNHRAAAKKNKAILCPVGEVWKQHFDNKNEFSYYGNDGFHPSLAGSKIAAKVIVKTLFSD